MKELEKKELTKGNIIYELEDGRFINLVEFLSADLSGIKIILVKKVGEFLTYIPDEEASSNPLVVEEDNNPPLRGKQMWLVQDEFGNQYRKELHIKMKRWITEYGKLEDDKLKKGRSTETISYSPTYKNTLETDFFIDKFLKVNGREIF